MTLSSTLRPERGFHFEYSTTLSLEDTKSGCETYILYILPPGVFVDKYELKQRPISFNLHGHVDLELPLAAVDDTPAVLEIRVLLGDIKVDFPLHARYPRPIPEAYSVVRVPEPQAFLLCPSADATPAQIHPFSHIPASYVPSFDLDSWNVTFFDTKTRERYHEIQVPAGTPADAQFVEFGTIITVLLAFLYVARAVWKTAARLHNPAHVKRQ